MYFIIILVSLTSPFLLTYLKLAICVLKFSNLLHALSANLILHSFYCEKENMYKKSVKGYSDIPLLSPLWTGSRSDRPPSSKSAVTRCGTSTSCRPSRHSTSSRSTIWRRYACSLVCMAVINVWKKNPWVHGLLALLVEENTHIYASFFSPQIFFIEIFHWLTNDGKIEIASLIYNIQEAFLAYSWWKRLYH